MNFIEVCLETTKEGLEIVSGLLYQSGLTGLQIEDEDDFKEFLNDPNRGWDYIDEELVETKHHIGTSITFYVSDNMSGLEQLNQIKSSLKQLQEKETEFSLGSLELTFKNIKEEDWANNWKKYFKPIAVGNRLIIKPSWEALPVETDKVILQIDPGHIFGTGTHETTQLCIEHIENYGKKGDKVLDIGCGSGILSIASLLLGASEADAVDMDPNAVEIAYENLDRNSIDRSRYRVVSGNILEDENLVERYSGKKYNMVQANIVADIIIALTHIVPKFIKDNGIFISSGIICERLEEVKEALEQHGFEILEVKTKKDWAAIASRFVG